MKKLLPFGMEIFSGLLTVAVAPGAVANPVLSALAAKLVKKLLPALVQALPSVE